MELNWCKGPGKDSGSQVVEGVSILAVLCIYMSFYPSQSRESGDWTISYGRLVSLGFWDLVVKFRLS